jgi:hypothetical protein
VQKPDVILKVPKNKKGCDVLQGVEQFPSK